MSISNTLPQFPNSNRCEICGRLVNAGGGHDECVSRRKIEAALLARRQLQCKECGFVKPLSSFNGDVTLRIGYRQPCSMCAAKRRVENGQTAFVRKRSLLPSGFYECTVCGELKLSSAFPMRTLKSGEIVASSHCRDCHNRRTAAWLRNNKEWNRQYRRGQQQKRRKSPDYRLASTISGAINSSLNGNKGGRHWESVVGYRLADLKEHLESRFLPGMNWDNHGRTFANGKPSWHIDHIRPVSSFSFSSYDDPEFKECWALSNLQPLWEADNLRKRDKWTG